MLIAVAVLFYYYIYNPADSENVAVRCGFKTLTGWDCAGCGAQRSVHHLLHGNLGEAMRYNFLFVILLPYFLLLIYYTIRSYLFEIPFPNHFIFSGKMALIFVGILIVYSVVRNLPFAPFHLLATP